MALKDIREQIKAILAGVSGIGVVHDYQRWAAHWDKFLNLFRDGDGKINGWMITRVKTPEECSTTSHHTRTYHFKIYGFYVVNDAEASELVFQDDLIEGICDAFRSKYQLNSTCDDNGPIQVLLVENRTFGGTLCHYCELGLVASKYDKAWS